MPNTRRRQSRRRGTVLIIVVVLLLATVSIAAAILQAVLLDARQHHVERFALQADRLAEAGLARGSIRLADDPAYRGETWKANLADGESATVAIRVTDTGRNQTLEAVATFPDGSDQPVRSTRRAVR